MVAGCGTVQAAYTAYMNREDEVVGIDLSEASLAHERFLQERHGLENVRLFKGDLLEVGSVDTRFDVRGTQPVPKEVVFPAVVIDASNYKTYDIPDAQRTCPRWESIVK